MDILSILLAATEAVVETAAEHTTEAESGGVLGTLGVNWKLFLAQLVNFSLVLFVFWKWIVNPLGKTLTARQERIEAGLKNSEEMEIKRKEFDLHQQGEMKKVRVEAEKVLKSATDTANKLKQDILAEAHTQSGKMLEQAKTIIESEKDQMLREVKQEVATLVVTASEKILRQKLDGKKDQELISESIKLADEK